MSTTIKGRFIQKHDMEANWNLATNFAPLEGEIVVYEPDETHAYPRFKVGDGATLVSALPFADAGTLTGASLSTVLNSSDAEIPTSKAVLDAMPVAMTNEEIDAICNATIYAASEVSV